MKTTLCYMVTMSRHPLLLVAAVALRPEDRACMDIRIHCTPQPNIGDGGFFARAHADKPSEVDAYMWSRVWLNNMVPIGS